MGGKCVKSPSHHELPRVGAWVPSAWNVCGSVRATQYRLQCRKVPLAKSRGGASLAGRSEVWLASRRHSLSFEGLGESEPFQTHLVSPGHVPRWLC